VCVWGVELSRLSISKSLQLGILLTLTLLFACLLSVTSSTAEPASPPQKWHGWWELGGYYGTDDSSRGEVTIFQPLGQTATSLFFAELKGKFFEEDTQEGNYALGHRRMLPSGWNLGLWGGFDLRNTDDDNTFLQASGGLEALSDRWDVRANGYVPLTDPKSSPSLAAVRLSGNNILMIGGEEVPLYGVDGEIGFKVFGGHRSGSTKDGLSNGRRHELRIYGGGFWFDADDALEEIAGPKGRIEFRIEDIIPTIPGSRLTLEGEVSHDDVRDDKWEVGARLRIPFGSSREDRKSAYAALSPQERRMTEGLERDTDIVLVESKDEKVEDAKTWVVFDQVAFADDSANLDTAIATGGNTLIILDGANNPVTGGKTLMSDQTLLGGDGKLKVKGVDSGTIANFTAPGTRPTLRSTGDVLTLANNTHATGLHIDQTGAGNADIALAPAGIRAPTGRDNMAVTYNTIDTFGVNSFGVRFTGSTRIEVNYNDITTQGFNAPGIFVSTNSSDIWIKHNNVTTHGDDAEAISIIDNNQNVGIVWNTIETTSTDDKAHGVFFGNNNQNVWLNYNVIETSSKNAGGIAFLNGNHDIWAMDNHITTNGDNAEGFFFFNDNFDVNLENNYVTTFGPGSHGMNFIDRNTDIWVKDNMILTMGVQAQGVTFRDRNQRLWLTDNHIETQGTNSAAFVFRNRNNQIDIINNWIDTEGEGLFTRDRNTNMTIRDNTFTTGKSALSFRRRNSVLIKDNLFMDEIGGNVVLFRQNPGVNRTTVFDGSTGNEIAPGTTIGGDVCAGRDNFITNGTFVIDGVTYVGGSPPCVP